MTKFEEYWFSLTIKKREKIANKVAKKLDSNTSVASINNIAKQRVRPSAVMSEAIEYAINKAVSAEAVMWPDRFN